jgi:hypothetical protein
MTSAATSDPATTITTSSGVWWNIKLGVRGDVASDDLTLDEIERLEKITEVPWAIGNPLASLRQAKAWLLVATMHAGASEEEATEHLAGLNLRDIKGAFQLHSGTAPLRLVDDEYVPPVPPSSAPTSVNG